MQFQVSEYSSYGSSDGGTNDLTAAIVAKIVDPDPHFRAAKLRSRIETLQGWLGNRPGSPLAGFWRNELRRSQEMLLAAERASGVQRSEEGIVTAGKAATWGVALLTLAGAIYLTAKVVRG